MSSKSGSQIQKVVAIPRGWLNVTGAYANSATPIVYLNKGTYSMFINTYALPQNPAVSITSSAVSITAVNTYSAANCIFIMGSPSYTQITGNNGEMRSSLAGVYTVSVDHTPIFINMVVSVAGGWLSPLVGNAQEALENILTIIKIA